MSFEEWQKENQQRQSGFEAWQQENQHRSQGSFLERVRETMKEHFEESWGAEIQRALVRGGRRLKGALPGTVAGFADIGGGTAMETMQRLMPLPPEQYAEMQEERRGMLKPLKEKAKEHYESSLDPEIAPRKSGVGGYVVNVVGETVPTAVAAIGATLVAGPAGGFIVGGAAESEAHVQEAMRESGLTEEELANERLLVFMISGALERMQADEVLKLSKAGFKPVIEAAKQRAWKKLGRETGKLSVKHAVGVVGESITETLQQATSIGAASLHGEKIFTKEHLRELGEATVAGAVGYGGLGAVGAGVRTGFEQASKTIDWSEYDDAAAQEETEFFEPEPRVMPHADTTDPEGETVIESEFRYGPRKPKEITTEEQATLERLEEEEIEPEPAKEGEEDGTVAPELYIGNVTPRAKEVWAEEFNRVRQQEGVPGEVEPSDVGPHREGPFPTKRTRVEMTRTEAEETLTQMEEGLEEEIMNWPEEGAGSAKLALLNALWGDIRNTRAALGKPIGQRPFRVNARGNQVVVEIKNPGQRVMEAIRGPGKKTLAEYNHKQLVTQGEALKSKLKAVARTAKRAWRQGNKEGIKKLRRHLRALKAKQRALQMIKQHRRRLIAKITAPVPENVSPLYAKTIRAMADALDPKGRSKATQRALAGLQREIEADPTVVGRIKSAKGLKLLKRLEQISATEISTDQLQELAAERSRLIGEGKLQQQRMAAKRRAAPTTKAATETLRKKKRRLGRTEDRQYNRKWVQKLAKQFKRGVFGFGVGQYRIDRFMEFLDDFKPGVFVKEIWRPLKKLAVESSVRRNLKQQEYYEFLKSIGVDGALWIGDRVKVELEDGRIEEFSKWELIGIYQLAQSDTGRSHLQETARQRELRQLRKDGKITEQQFLSQWFERRSLQKMTDVEVEHYRKLFEQQMKARENLALTDTDIDQIVQKIDADEQMKQVADWQLQQLNERWESILATALEIGIDPNKLVKVGRYVPLLLKDVDAIDQDDLLHRVLGEFIPEDYQVERKFLETRKSGAKGAVELDANLLFMHSIAEVEHFLTLAPKLSQLSHMMADRQFRHALNNATYGKGTEVLAKWIVDTARGRVVREHDWVSRWVHKMSRHGVIYALGFNIPVVLRQSISMLNAAATDPRMLKYLAESVVMNADPASSKALYEKVASKSKVVAEREMEHHIADPWNAPFLKKQMQRAFGHKIKGAQFSKLALSWVRRVDMWTVVRSWDAAYETALEQGANEQQAINYADQVVQRTQPMARPEDLPHFYRGGALQQIITLFTNQVNQNLNFWVHDIYGAKKHGRITNTEVAYRVFMSYVMPAIVFGTLSRGGAPPDKEQLVQDLALYVGGSPIIFGNMVRHALTGWGNSFGLWKTGMTGFADAARAAERGDWRGVLKNGAKGAAVGVGPISLKGAPTGAMIRAVEGGYDLYTGSTDDPRRLLWSEWALKQGKAEDEGRTRKTRKRKRRRRKKRR